MKPVIGIDPGQSGSISVRYSDYTETHKMPKTESDIFLLLQEIYNTGKAISPICYIEKVHSFPGQGVASSFKFGQGYGFLRGCLIALRIPFRDITPQKWQKEFIPVKKKESKTDHKNRLKGAAQQLFPNIKVTLALADSLLIAEYGYRNERI